MALIIALSPSVFVAADVTKVQNVREVWKVENLPSNKKESESFINVFQEVMADWITDTRSHLDLLEALGVESRRIADILEWSFQVALDRVQIGPSAPRPWGPARHLCWIRL